MSKNYILNTKTGTLHFRGYCHHIATNVKDDGTYISFPTENAAKKKNAISVKWCKVCAKKIENKLDK